jgi:hypothetical protein
VYGVAERSGAALVMSFDENLLDFGMKTIFGGESFSLMCDSPSKIFPATSGGYPAAESRAMTAAEI